MPPVPPLPPLRLGSQVAWTGPTPTNVPDAPGANSRIKDFNEKASFGTEQNSRGCQHLSGQARKEGTSANHAQQLLLRGKSRGAPRGHPVSDSHESRGNRTEELPEGVHGPRAHSHHGPGVYPSDTSRSLSERANYLRMHRWRTPNDCHGNQSDCRFPERAGVHPDL